MKILYTSDRINANDGSSVHCRAFVESIRQIGHEIQTFPPIIDIEYSFRSYTPDKKGLMYYLKRLRKVNIHTLIYYLKKTNAYVSEFVSMLEGLVRSVKQYAALRGILNTYEPDIIIHRYHVFSYASSWISRAYKIPLLVEVNSLRSMEAKLSNKHNKPTFITRRAEHKVIKSADYVFSVSNPIKDYIDTHIEPKESSVIPNGVDINKFNPKRFDKELLKDKLGLKGKIVIGYVGSYKRWHGLDVAIDMIQSLSRKTANYHLLLIGNGPCFTSIKKKIIDKNLDCFVTQINYIPHTDVAEHIASFDYALMSYPNIDSFYFSPLKMFEYMAAGIPVVASDFPFWQEIIERHNCGICVDPHNPQEIAKAVNTLLTDNELAAAMGANGRRAVEEVYNWQNEERKLLNLYQELI